MSIPALLKKRLVLSHPILRAALIFAVLGFFAGCGGSSGGGWFEGWRCFPFKCIDPPPPDNQPPTTPTNLKVEAISPAEIDVDWDTSTDNKRVKGYKIYRDGLYLANRSAASFLDSGLYPDTKHCYTVSAYDGSNNESPKSRSSCTTTPPDLTAPTPPAKLTAGAVSSDQIDLRWAEPSDDGIVLGYKIFRDGSLITDVAETSFTDSGLDPETRYCYTVSAYDAGGNESDPSNQACVVSSWITTAIDPPYCATCGGSSNWNQRPAITIDSSNDVHVVYEVWSLGADGYYSQELKYAKNIGESWQINYLGYDGNSPSMALDSADRLHISFVDDGHLHYANNVSGGWLTGYTDPKELAYGHSIAIDPTDHVHIICETNNWPIKYITNASGTWWTEELYSESSGDISLNSIVVDLYGHVHIIFSDFGDLKYLTNASGDWITETVDSQVYVGHNNSIAVDSAGNVNISYYDSTNADLKYATNSSGVWVTETADSQGDVGRYPSIAVDSYGNAHISYYDSTNESLDYISNASGEWERYILDDWRDFVGYEIFPFGYGISSIALDSANKVHIVYQWGHDIRYITNR
jgi:chitodextrinase